MAVSDAKKAYMRAWRAANPDKVQAARVRERSTAQYRTRMQTWRKANRRRLTEYDRAYKQAHPEVVARGAPAKKAYRERNLAKYAAYAAKRRAQQLRATPLWADLGAIQVFYERRPEGADVDHIVPLVGGSVCGLHVLENLRYLTRSENARRPRKYCEH